VTVYTALAVAVVGTPEMTPVVVLSCRPNGRSGETPYEAMTPPVL
jgi:hypothetical protein